MSTVFQSRQTAEAERRKKKERRSKIILNASLCSVGLLAVSSLALFLFIEAKKPAYKEQIIKSGGKHHLLQENHLARYTDRNNRVIDRTARNSYHERGAGSMKEIDPIVKQAILESEDETFYTTDSMPAIFLKSSFRIAISRGTQGGSGIHQQLAKILVNLDKDRDLSHQNVITKTGRKLDEWAATAALFDIYKLKYSADFQHRILLDYYNNVYVGVNTYGFKNAARVYFHKDISELNLREKVTLVVLLSQPNAYFCQDELTLAKNHKHLRELRDRLLDKLATGKIITPAQAAESKSQPLGFKFDDERCDRQNSSYYFKSEVDLRVNELFRGNFNIRKLFQKGGFAAKLTIDADIQAAMEEIISRNIRKFGNYGISEGAAIVMDASTGKIRAIVGGKNADGADKYNRATQAMRQPASIFKVIPYIAALEAGISPHTKYSCAASTWNGRQLKPCGNLSPDSQANMYDGMAYSENAIAWQIAKEVGMSKILKWAKWLGISGNLEADYSTVIGQGKVEVTLMQMARIYGAIANNGVMQRPQYIEYIFDSSSCQDRNKYRDCSIIYNFNRERPNPLRVLMPQTAATMNDILHGAVHKSGATGRLADLGSLAPDIAGKTGTNGVDNNARDLWFVGYSKQHNLVCAIWLGSEDNDRPIRSVDLRGKIGGNLAAKVFAEVMRAAIVRNR